MNFYNTYTIVIQIIIFVLRSITLVSNKAIYTNRNSIQVESSLDIFFNEYSDCVREDGYGTILIYIIHYLFFNIGRQFGGRKGKYHYIINEQ